MVWVRSCLKDQYAEKCEERDDGRHRVSRIFGFYPLGGEKSKIEKFQLNIYFCIPMMYIVLKFQNVAIDIK